MDAARISQLNRERLATCHVLFAEAVAEMIVAGLQWKQPLPPLLVAQAWRSPTVQREAYESGHSEKLFGWHNTEIYLPESGAVGVKPAACAVDFVDADDKPYSEEPYLFAWLAIEARRRGLRTGVCFGLAENVRAVRLHLIQTKNVDALALALAKKRGWDPLHVEPGEAMIEKLRSELLRVPSPTS